MTQVSRSAVTNAMDCSCQQLLLEAVSDNRIHEVRALAEAGAKVAAPDSNGCTPVYFAAGLGHVAVIEVLAELGADLSAPDSNGTTPLFMAAQDGHVQAIHALVRLGVEINAVDNDGATV